MKAATYTRSCRRNRNVNKSDCHSWLGSALSKRCGEGLAPGFLRGASRLGARPSSFNTRRTVVSEAPSPKKRFTTSRMRRLPACGCSRLTASTASRRGSARAAFTDSRCSTRLGSSAASPPARYLRPHSPTVVYGMFSFLETCCALIPWSTIIEAAAFITSGGHAVLPCLGAVSELCLFALLLFVSTLFAPSGPSRPAQSEEEC